MFSGTEDGELRPVRDYLVMPAVLDDLPFIQDSWCASYAQSPAVLNVDPQIFKVEQRALIAGLVTRGRVAVARPRTHVQIDGRQSKATDILGWICYEFDGAMHTPVCHYCYVKRNFRDMGIARQLFADALNATDQTTVFCTHFTPALKALQPKTNLFFNPYVLTVAKLKGDSRA